MISMILNQSIIDIRLLIFDLVGAAVNSRETSGENIVDKTKFGSSEGIGGKLGFSEIVTF